jgi:hypothetical protein
LTGVIEIERFVRICEATAARWAIVRLIGGRHTIVWDVKVVFDCCLTNANAGQLCSWTICGFKQVQTKALNVGDADDVDNGYCEIGEDCCKSITCVNVCFVGILFDEVRLKIKCEKLTISGRRIFC